MAWVCEQCGRTLSSAGGYQLHLEQHGDSESLAGPPAAPMVRPDERQPRRQRRRARSKPSRSGYPGSQPRKRSAVAVVGMMVGISAGRWAAPQAMEPDTKTPPVQMENSSTYPRTVLDARFDPMPGR
ncbi:MAG: hypothetical protein M3011_14215 [Actinomycetota bacterium]|nr:hypothetical protein [Actinomycetota bacterium]